MVPQYLQHWLKVIYTFIKDVVDQSVYVFVKAYTCRMNETRQFRHKILDKDK